METTLGGKILAAAVLDKDYRSNAECSAIASECRSFCSLIAIHECKEIENFLLVPMAIDRAAMKRLADRAKRTGEEAKYASSAADVLGAFAVARKSYVTAQYLANRRRFERVNSPGSHEAEINEVALEEFDAYWEDPVSRLQIIPGKDAMGALNQHFQDHYGISVTPTAIIDAMKAEEIPAKMTWLLRKIDEFATEAVRQ